MSNEPDTQKPVETSLVKPTLVAVAALAILIALSIGFHGYFNDQAQEPVAQPATTQTASKMHTAEDALTAVKTFYDDYLPLKAQTYDAVGDNTAVEPAAVQIARASEPYLATAFYNSVLKSYMAEFQASGKVNHDALACITATSAAHTETLVSHTKDSAIINTTFTTADNTTKSAQVVVSLATLRISNITCQP